MPNLIGGFTRAATSGGDAGIRYEQIEGTPIVGGFDPPCRRCGIDHVHQIDVDLRAEGPASRGDAFEA